MVNWFNYKTVFIVLLLGGLLQSSTKKSDKVNWGFFGHKRINRIAVFTLPAPMFGFYKQHINYLTAHAADADMRRYAFKEEAPRHYIDLDQYQKTGSAKIPVQWKDAVNQYSVDSLQLHGIVPWWIMVMHERLKNAFAEKDVQQILKLSADIGHYIGDSHVPLHTTENYNGQMTGQKGIHGLWESRLVEINAEDYDYFVGKIKYVSNVQDFAWDAVRASHLALDSVLRIEKELTKEFPSDRKYSYEQRGNTTISVYSQEFCEAYHRRMNGMVERRLKAAILAVGCIWYTAWVDAGQPDLTKLQTVPPSAELLKEFADLDAHFHNDKHFGRICE